MRTFIQHPTCTYITLTGKARPLVDSVFPMEDALKAFERLQTNRATGKVVVKIDPSAE